MDNDKGGIYANLFDAHPPFQIDGNFGATAGISEMLLQSHNGSIDILPALPSAWKKGSIKGLKAVGNFTIDIDWIAGAPSKCTLMSGSGQPCILRFPNSKLPATITTDGKPVSYTVIDGAVYFNTQPNTYYLIKL